jgi:hypothetical protein
MAKTIGKWLYMLGLLIAAVAGLLSFSSTWLWIILVLMGILAAVLFLDPDDVVNAGIRYLVLVAVRGALDMVPGVGPYITGIFTGVVAFLGPVILTVLVVYFVKKYFMKQIDSDS